MRHFGMARGGPLIRDARSFRVDDPGRRAYNVNCVADQGCRMEQSLIEGLAAFAAWLAGLAAFLLMARWIVARSLIGRVTGLTAPLPAVGAI